MTEIIVIGAGGHAAEINDYIHYSYMALGEGSIKIIGFIDDNPLSYQAYKLGGPYLGGIKDHKVNTDCYYLMAIANIKYRRPIIEDFINKGAKFTDLIHPTAYISPSSSIGSGTIIGPHVNIGPNVTVGQFNLINSRCSLGHDTKLGDYNFISPNVCFSGNTKVGDENLFGINSVTIPNIHVGNRNKIAAGMVLDQNVKDESVVFYRFKEKIMAVPKK